MTCLIPLILFSVIIPLIVPFYVGIKRDNEIRIADPYNLGPPSKNGVTEL